ncbi:MAG: disulfide bond formation protein B [Tistlia sp.]|uniref:disulfide bond formation protein B n=1 Tax=Tistlia sp. TaxID=3057121 RepID=UPI0034A10932
MSELLARHPLLAPLVGLLAGPAAIALALVAQHGFGLEPCVLCIWQRWALGIAALLALPAVIWRGPARRLSLAASGLGYLASAAIAGFHSGVENGWWQGTAGCHAPSFQGATSAEQLRESLMATAVVACDEVSWSLLGLSMADYNLLYSAALGLFLLVAARLLTRRKARP